MSDTDPSLTGHKVSLDFEDPSVRDELRMMTHIAVEPGALFGRGFDFTPERRELAQGVVDAAKEKLSPMIESQQREWDALQSLIQEGEDKGVLLSFVNHEGTFVPSWCIDGGQGTPVHKVRSDDGQPMISVSSELFTLYNWTRTVDALDKTVSSTDEALKGRVAAQLGVPLGRLSHLIVSK